MAYVGESVVYFKYNDDEFVDFHLCYLFDEQVELDILEIKHNKARQRQILKDQIITLFVTPIQLLFNLCKLNFKEVKFLSHIEIITIKDLSQNAYRRLFYRSKRKTI